MSKEKLIEDILKREEYKEFLNGIENRKIVAFGATPIAEEIIKCIPQKASYYIDNDSSKWNKSLNGIPVYNPDVLLDEKEDIAILVTNTYFEEISTQIRELELSNYIIIDGDKVFSRLKQLIKFEEIPKIYEDFIRKMPTIEEFSKNEMYDNIYISKSKGTIGVVISNHIFFSLPWYLTIMSGLLKYAGSDVMIIWDDVNEFSDMLLDWKGVSRFQDEYIDYAINLLSNKLNIKVIKISELNEKDLDKEDLVEIEKLSEINTIWKYRVSSMGSIPEMRKLLLEYKENYQSKLLYNLKKIKSILEISKFERIVVPTGLYDYMGLYNWLGKKKGFDVGSIDFGGAVLISTDKECAHQMDIKKILKENLLEKNIKENLIQMGKEIFKEAMSMRREREKGVHQEISYDEDHSKEQYDIVIPLNIGWDGAALRKNQFFSNAEEWIIETVEFILNNTNYTVAVRQHPAEKKQTNINQFFKEYNSFFKKYESGEDLFMLLNDRFSNNERFRYIKGDEKINTYKLISKAKLILPHTSTMGIESVILGKNVLIESDVYYGDCSIVKKANSKENYFNQIKELCEEKNGVSPRKMEEALIVYMLSKFNRFNTEFTPWIYTWLDRNIEDILTDKNIKSILKAFGDGIPIVISQLESTFSKDRDF